MATFTYKGITLDDTPISGVIEAYDEIEAMESARAFCRIVQEVQPVQERQGLLTRELSKPKVKPKRLAIMCSQFATILKAGLPVARAMDLVSDQVGDKYLKKVLLAATEDVSAGHGVADSLENKGPYLPRVFIETIRAGEESGHLPEAFERLHMYFNKRAKVAGKVASALTYPVFVLVIAVVVVTLMMILVIPAMTGMITSMGTETPAITQFLIDVSGWMAQNYMWLFVALIALAIATKMFARTERGKVFFATAKLRIPVLGKVSVYSCAAQFANTMSTLLASGLPSTKAIRTTARVLDNYVVAHQVGLVEAGLEEGKSLADCIGVCTYFPRSLVEMCAVGEQTGELEETLETMGTFYDEETQRVTDRALSLMEPTLLVCMAIFAGFIVIALYLPMFTMYGTMM
ncbi:MAG: type II secretion system F family protein [Raoultibacter sp.]